MGARMSTELLRIIEQRLSVLGIFEQVPNMFSEKNRWPDQAAADWVLCRHSIKYYPLLSVTTASVVYVVFHESMSNLFRGRSMFDFFVYFFVKSSCKYLMFLSALMSR